MDNTDYGRAPSGQALVASDEARADLHPSGFDPSREEFCERFKAHMLRRAGQPEFDDGGSIAEYADEAAQTYFEDVSQREWGPEECAEADMSYWGE